MNFIGIIGIFVLLGLAWLMSYDKKNIPFKKLLSDSNLFSDVEFFLFARFYKLKYLSIPVDVRDNKGKVNLLMMIYFVLNALKFKFSKNYKIGVNRY